MVAVLTNHFRIRVVVGEDTICVRKILNPALEYWLLLCSGIRVPIIGVDKKLPNSRGDNTRPGRKKINYLEATILMADKFTVE